MESTSHKPAVTQLIAVNSNTLLMESIPHKPTVTQLNGNKRMKKQQKRSDSDVGIRPLLLINLQTVYLI